eukprot:NODE_605_length_5450_cov_0.733695.p4 type:complete len:113 gc:universal NODE_605_length_5450_cov_0.733695:4570-4232(-)
MKFMTIYHEEFNPETFNINAATTIMDQKATTSEIDENRVTRPHLLPYASPNINYIAPIVYDDQRKSAYQVNRMYNCNFPKCEKAYSRIGHLNNHRKIKSHGKPLKKTDFEIR